MSSAFGDVRTVLEFVRPKRRGGAPPPWIGWPTARFFGPAFARQILVRERRLRPLNVLQEYVLKLLQAGIRDPDKIARLLMPEAQPTSNEGPPLLVRRIFEELRRAELIVGEALTELGREVVEESSANMVEYASRYAFQDPWTGAVWRRFPERLLPALIEVKLPKGGGTTELTRGKRRERAFVVDPGEVQPCAIPDKDTIKKAFKEFALDRDLAIGNHNDPEAGDDEALADTPLDIQDIIDIGREEPVYLLVTAFSQESRGGSQRWRAADPFGIGGEDDLLSETVADWRGKPDGARFAHWLSRRSSAKQADSQEPAPESEPVSTDEGVE
jgi:hypothetical protein